MPAKQLVQSNHRYPVPSAIGGTLIRKTIAQLKAGGISLPISHEIYIATSGGVDSMVLAHLLACYGRRMVARERITLLHFDHQWRKESGTTEKKLIEAQAKKWGVNFKSVQLAKPGAASKNAEEDARLQRRQQFDLLAGGKRAHRYVFTAHHSNDVAETFFWRFLRGEFHNNSQGILFNDDPVLRPFLQVSKEEIRDYARAEKVKFLEDPTNQNADQMRGFFRHALFPLLEEKFPNFQTVLSRYAQTPEPVHAAAPVIEAILSHKLNRHQRTQLEKLKLHGELTLPGGIVLVRVKEGFLIRA